jgi:hypothetical protein
MKHSGRPSPEEKLLFLATTQVKRKTGKDDKAAAGPLPASILADGRSHRKRLGKPTFPEQLAEAAKGLWDQGLLMQEIGDRLTCDPDAVAKAIGYWFRSRGLKPPDGRARRKDLFRKCSPKAVP